MYDFNTRYLDLYVQLESEDRGAISVIDYENALRPRAYIYEKVAMAEADILKKACSLAEMYEKILQDSHSTNLINRNRTNRYVWLGYKNIQVNDPINSHFHKYKHSSPSNTSLNYNSYLHNSSRNAFNIDRTNQSNRNCVRNNNFLLMSMENITRIMMTE